MRYFTILCLTFFTFQLQAQSPIMQPTISPDGNQLAFSFQGDIWISDISGNNTKRLTIHEAYESNPVWSNEGQHIVFSSDRFGNDDLFKTTIQGGTPERLTYHSASDNPYSITSDGDVLFTTSRNYRQVEREAEIYVLEKGASTEKRFLDALGFDPVSSPDGNKIAFVRGTCRIAREAYNGPANRDVWVFDKTTGDYTQITKHGTNDFNPHWLNNDKLVFISGRSGRYNIHQTNLDGNTSQLTNRDELGIINFSVSPQTNTIAFQTAKQSYTFDIYTKKAQPISMNISSDYRFDPVVKKSMRNSVDEFSVSPNARFIAYINRGELFVTRNDKEDSKSVRLTNGPARESNPVWLNDSVLLFISDREDQKDLYTMYSTDDDESDLFYSFKRATKRLTKTKDEESNPVVSPDGKKIAIEIGRGGLKVFNIDEKGKLSKAKTLLDGWDSPSGVTWSPDSQWLAYSKSDLNFNEDVFIHAADNSHDPVNVSMHPKGDYNPVWSKNGSKLGFVSERNNGDNDIWFAWLKKEDWGKSKAEWTRREKEKDDKNKSKPKKKGDENDEEKQEETKDIVIDFDKIYQRLEQVTRFTGGESDFTFDAKGEHIYYTNGGVSRKNYDIDRRLFKIKWDGSDKKEIKGGSNTYGLQKYPLKTKIYFMSRGGQINVLNTKSDKIEKLPVNSEMKIRYKEELTQIFEEGWRVLNAGFYDPEFHGQDWDKLKKTYKPLALNASTKEDFRMIFNLMLGQLNASHMGLYGSNEQKNTQSERTGLLGVEGESTTDGFKITRVVYDSPADKTDSQLQVGDVITGVNQNAVKSSENFYSHLEGSANERTLLSVIRNGDDLEMIIWPTNSLRTELYNEWVENRRQLVEEYSDGRLGYLHIQGMNWSSFERFERELMAAGYGKEGIVIDVRYNGGGWTTDYLMAVLNVDQHAYTIPRGAAKSLENHKNFKENYPFGERLPLASWTKPSIALCNQNSYSNAEIFSHAYKTLDLGTLVGTPTFGAVISTGGARLQDGSYIRLPFRAWYVKATEENMENGPAVPDIIINNPPAYKAKNIDPQLKRAVDELLNQL
ncbi:S41 family peptidase [Mesohalobacter halotolerans]|uniref:Tricorn protease homolog n=1 Tax=Mesohalobacter halotolerans TaxID=1883405 RepID=A0A4U5TV88_9FLAO|nr:S41 family peptidase [Mesohalobacter halotolerans]TKS57494.1 PDZ domain-containing protein [Mesohalobacter halotolerans]